MYNLTITVSAIKGDTKSILEFKCIESLDECLNFIEFHKKHYQVSFVDQCKYLIEVC